MKMNLKFFIIFLSILFAFITHADAERLEDIMPNSADPCRELIIEAYKITYMINASIDSMDSWKKSEAEQNLIFELSDKFRGVEGLGEDPKEFDQETLVKYENYLKNTKLLDPKYVKYAVLLTEVGVCEINNSEYENERRGFKKIIKDKERELLESNPKGYEKIISSFKKLFDESHMDSSEEEQAMEDLIISNAAYSKLILQHWDTQ